MNNRLSVEQQQAIDGLRLHYAKTVRPTVKALENILYQPLPVLDHGFIRVVDYMGDDSAIVQAARVSYGKGTKQVSADHHLINYLMRNLHTTPFEMCEIKLHVKLPIFVARQWIRHRTANVNEYSARYSLLDKEYYIPSASDLATQSLDNRQGREHKALTPEEAARVLAILRADAELCYKHYIEMLNINEKTNEVLDPTRQGLARELARMNLNLNYYTQWYWKIDLHNLLNFIMLRADSHAQFEIREYAQVLLDIVNVWTPLTYNAFLEYKMHSLRLSSKAVSWLKKKIRGIEVSQEDSGMSKREWQELMTALEL